MSICVSDQESDKLSVISESDSGIFGAANANTPGSSNSACSSRGQCSSTCQFVFPINSRAYQMRPSLVR